MELKHDFGFIAQFTASAENHAVVAEVQRKVSAPCGNIGRAYKSRLLLDGLIRTKSSAAALPLPSPSTFRTTFFCPSCLLDFVFLPCPCWRSFSCTWSAMALFSTPLSASAGCFACLDLSAARSSEGSCLGIQGWSDLFGMGQDLKSFWYWVSLLNGVSGSWYSFLGLQLGSGRTFQCL
ncbi:hypothetical protein EYF80_012789 [Liparis tanakae]|uniref:Uncharacterized protein n=1 Tax=Liparis tanakae TaxID=230148 RepID=A0A4Z2IIC1_9TELE|nr:hypothetical protein EYF80_012789 [Liparis tanakae]